MIEWDFRILGPLDVHRRGTRIEIGPAKQRTLLACLLLRANHPVGVEDIADRLWTFSSPEDARSAVHLYVNRLRRALGGATAGPTSRSRVGGVLSGPITTGPHSYLISLEPDELDLLRLDTFEAKARAAAVAGDIAAELPALDGALALWRGRPLCDIRSDRLQAEAGSTLLERRFRLLERRNDLLLRLGRPDEVVAELTAITSEHPLRERFWAQMIRGLHQAGRQAEALSAYQAVAAVLADQLGVDPGEELRALHLAILTDSVPDPPLTLVQRLAVRTLPAQAPESQPASRPPRTVRQLPPATAGFVGRTTELDRLDAWLRGCAARTADVMAIVGPAGIGKTTLAVAAAYRASELFPEGQLFVDLSGYAAGSPLGGTEVLGRFLRALGLRSTEVPPEEDERRAAFRTLLAGRRVLVVLDDARTAEQARGLLPGSGRCAVLVTSRNELTGLTTWPGADRIVLGELSAADSRQLLGEVLERRRLGAERGAVDDLVQLCGGLPLALRIAAAQLASRPGWRLADYVTGLARQSPARSLSVPGDERSTVCGALDLSYESLDVTLTELFGLLGLMPAPDVSVPSVAALAGVDEAAAEARLDALAAVSLIEPTTPRRYKVHDLVRQYAAARGELDIPCADRQAAHERLFRYYICTADATLVSLGSVLPRPLPSPRIPPFPDCPAALAWLESERAAIVVAIQEAERAWPGEVSWQLADALLGYFLTHGDVPRLRRQAG